MNGAGGGSCGTSGAVASIMYYVLCPMCKQVEMNKFFGGAVGTGQRIHCLFCARQTGFSFR